MLTPMQAMINGVKNRPNPSDNSERIIKGRGGFLRCGGDADASRYADATEADIALRANGERLRILVGMSGGLDSAYAATLLLKAGHYVEGAVLRMSEYTDISAASEVSAAVGIPLHTVDCSDEFKRLVADELTREYSCGRTPNPCVTCNRLVKIESLRLFAAEHGFDRIATGHYAAVAKEDGRYFIRRAADITRDQSYVLWRLTQRQLAMLTTPLAGLIKDEIRARAVHAGLSAADRPESREICFIPDNDYVGYIERTAGKFPAGEIIAPDGSVAGSHNGIIRYTIGQRKGLGVALGRPVFVSRIDAVSNRIYLSDTGGEFGNTASVSNLSFQKLPPTENLNLRCDVKIRYAAPPSPADVTISGNTAHVRFDSPVRAITPGQSAVFYNGDDILFGGIIE